MDEENFLSPNDQIEDFEIDEEVLKAITADSKPKIDKLK
jgi:hypothetical protein